MDRSASPQTSAPTVGLLRHRPTTTDRPSEPVRVQVNPVWPLPIARKDRPLGDVLAGAFLQAVDWGRLRREILEDKLPEMEQADTEAEVEES